LRTAGVTRPELFERTAARQPIRVHDLRATFVTVSLANICGPKISGTIEQLVGERPALPLDPTRHLRHGQPCQREERNVGRRTGHRSSAMINAIGAKLAPGPNWGSESSRA
jgi:hypothetical protein